MDVSLKTAVGELKTRLGLRAWAFRFRGVLNDADTMGNLGLHEGDTISLCASGATPVQKANLRLQAGSTARRTAASRRYNHLNLPAQTREVLTKAVLMESQQTRVDI